MKLSHGRIGPVAVEDVAVMAVEAAVAVMVGVAAEVAVAIVTTTVPNASRAGKKKVMSDE